jgi:DNA-binding response OmpR family regulator
MSKKTLVVEGDADLANLAASGLRDLAHEVTIVDDGHVALDLATKQGFDLIVLDLMLPRIDGLEILRRIRAHATYTPVLMLTSREADVDRIVDLEIGADDYLVKPFAVTELVARMKALLQRVETPAEAESLDFGELVIDSENRQVTVRGEVVELTAKEFDLLLQFARYPGRVYTRAQLLDLVWGYGHDDYEHTLNSAINHLRAKIEADQSQPSWILTVWGVGYKFAGG